MIRILFLGDVVGEPGRRAVITTLSEIRDQHRIDFTIVNGENAAAGRGITPKIAIDLLRAGAAVITSGDHIWDQKEIIPYIDTEPRLLRPINYPDHTPGQGTIILDTSKGKIGVVNVQGRTFMLPHLENPFLALEKTIAAMREETRVIFVDVHAETTSEKIAIGRFLDGQVSAVVGTHTHVQTADEQVFPGGTAFICDAGMCGPETSILGREVRPIVDRFLTSMPTMFPIAKGDVLLHGVIVEIDERSGKAHSISRFRQRFTIPEGRQHALQAEAAHRD